MGSGFVTASLWMDNYERENKVKVVEPGPEILATAGSGEEV